MSAPEAESPDLAKAALEKADLEELQALYKKKVLDCDALSKTLDMMMKHYSDKTSSPRMEASTDAISAMERVALAAIGLAQSIVEKQPKP